MKTLRLITGLGLVLATLLAPAGAQSVAELRKELNQKKSAAGSDVAALIEVAKWAEEKGLVSDRRKILNDILKLDPENEAAHEALGFVKYEGEWVTKSKAELMRRKALEEEMKAKGFVEVDGVWLPKEEVDAAKKGIFMHDGERVSKAEKLAFSAGKTRHRVTGEFIDVADEAKANEGQFPLANGKWGDEAEADKFHANPATPWLYRTHYATVISTKPLAEIKTITGDLDSGFDSVKPILGDVDPSPAHRPVIHIARDSDEYRQLGAAIGAEGSVYAVFAAIREVEAAGLGTVRPIVMNWDKDWGPYWLRHAAGLAYVNAVLADLSAEAPLWFERGIAGYAERHFNPGVASFFGKQHLQKGGVQDLAAWFQNFEISANLETRMIDFNIYQAGLVLDFAMHGGDDASIKAMQAVTKAASSGDGAGLTKAIAALQKVLISKEDAIRERLRQVTQG